MSRSEGLSSLFFLILSNNMLEEFEARFYRRVNTLLLNNNMIKQVPNISEASELSHLSLRNQNESLKTVFHYSFERIGTPKKLRIDLKENQAIRFENKVFFNIYTTF
jgi:hypothetical protein